MGIKGFTLIELIVVIAIIAILAAVVAPTAMRAVDRARVTNAIQAFDSIKSATLSYNADTGQWPVTTTETPVATNNFLTDPGAVTGWDGPYLERWPISPWGNANQIQFTNAAASSVFGLAANERYVRILNVPAGWGTGTPRARIDAALDNGDGNAQGIVRENAGQLVILIQRQ